MAGIGTHLNLAVGDNYASIHFSLIRFFQELLKSSNPASTRFLTLIFLLLYYFTDLKSHNTASPTPFIHFTEGLRSMDVVMRWCGPLDLRDADMIERWDFYCESLSLMWHQLDRRGIECLAVS